MNNSTTLRRGWQLLPCAILFLLLSLPARLTAQESVPYRILLNDPTRVPTTYVDLLYFDYEGSMSNQLKWHKGVPGLGATAQFELKPLDKMGFEGKATLFYTGKKTQFVKLPFHLEGGGVISLKSKIKEQPIKVPLKTFKTKADVVTDDGQWLGTVDAIGYNYIEVMAKKEFRTWARAGLMFRRSTYRPMNDGNYTLGAQTVGGVYLGVEVTRRAHVVTELSDKVALSAEYMKMYADIMVYPLATVSTPQRNNRTPIGFRIGATGKLPGMKNVLNYMFPKVEFGLYPLDGFYWSVGLGINLYKA
ncbi:MAG: hypothetical protein H6581_29760 [Bacteroidia bacterium]|nr:hypothetical protein [Bacteroidia bacterium]